MIVLRVLFSVLIVVQTDCARILGIVSTPSYSHQIAFRPLWKELLSRGHHLTVLTTDPMRDPALTNLTEIDLSISYKRWIDMNFNELSKIGFFELMEKSISMSAGLMDEQMSLPEVKALVKNETEQFDLLLVEMLLPSMAAFSERFNCPFVTLLSLDGYSLLYHTLGNPSHPVVNPDFIVGVIENLNFFQRLMSTFFMVSMKFLYSYFVIPLQNEMIKKHFGNGYPTLEDILDRTSMLFVNTDTVFHPIRPLLPNIIQFGGGNHFTPLKPLPKDLQIQLDNAKNGFIYFSLGSNIRSDRLPESTMKIFLEAFSELPYTILWKFEKDDLPGKPDNVILSKWFPQQDILRHPNIKLFITQGGVQSMEEAIYNHIPIVGIPFFGDQHQNIRRLVSKGIALMVDHETMDKSILKQTILGVINNPSYCNRMKELTELVKDQPMTGLERAVWWTEYVIRHKGVAHLRSPALDLPAYQYYLLDVIGFCLILLLIIVYILVKVVKLIYRLFKYLLPKSKLKTQ